MGGSVAFVIVVALAVFYKLKVPKRSRHGTDMDQKTQQWITICVHEVIGMSTISWAED